MWSSDPPIYPQLTEEECDELVSKARRQKGQLLYSQAYAKKTKGAREFPTFTAKEFRDFIIKRGQARAKDKEWGSFDVDKDNENVLKLLALYFTQDERFLKIKDGYSFRKGLFLIGPMGVGKTVLMELCDINPLNSYTAHKCTDIVAEFSISEDKKGGQRVIDAYSMDTLSDNTQLTFGHTVLGRFYDDLGQEKMGYHYKREENVMEVISENRYNQGSFFRTHMTSNLRIEQLPERYGPRVEDRFYEMFNVIEFPSTAKSRRRR